MFLLVLSADIYLWLCQISVNHRYVYNAIYDNLAFAENRSTIFLKSAKFDFHDNFLVNPYNLYEVVTFNRTKYVQCCNLRVIKQVWHRSPCCIACCYCFELLITFSHFSHVWH